MSIFLLLLFYFLIKNILCVLRFLVILPETAVKNVSLLNYGEKKMYKAVQMLNIPH